MRAVPTLEKLYEKKVEVNQIDIFSLNNEALKNFLKGLPREKQQKIISAADKAMTGIIKGFSSIELDYGNPINWHYNPLTKSESIKNIKWYCIPDFDENRGDIKVVWEASRFTHFYYFTRAFLITGDSKYYTAFSQQIEHWIKDNPYPYGANYKCGQECTLRMINTLMAYSVFKSAELVGSDDENNIRKIVEVCYKKILSNFFYAHKCIKNNHTISEICGLIIGAWCCKDEKRMRKAYKLIENELQSQFLPDGGYIQWSFNYQRFALQLIECLFKISEKTGYNISEKSKTLVRKSVILMYQMQDESGDMPNYGSNDGALIFPVTVCRFRDFRPVINTVHALVTGMRLFDKGDYDEELLWFGDGIEKPKADTERIPSAFYESGLYTIRRDDGFIMVCLQDYKTRPAQMDQLHIDLWHKGRNIFCDSGTYSYASPIGKDMASTAAHNTVKVASLEQMNKWGTFHIYNWTKCKNVKYDINSFIGTMISNNGYEHTRRIENTSYGYVIRDEVICSGKECSFLLHTPYEVKITSSGFEIWDRKIKLCVVKANIQNIEVVKAYRSLYYLIKEEINCVVIKCNVDKNCSLKLEIELNEKIEREKSI